MALTGLAGVTSCTGEEQESAGSASRTHASKPSDSPDGKADGKADHESKDPAGHKSRELPWNLDRIDQSAPDLDHRFHTTATGEGVRVYLLDCQVDLDHAQLGGRVSQGADTVGGKPGGCHDDMGVSHGTFVAGIIAGKDTGVAPKSRIVAVRSMSGGEGERPVPKKTSEKRIVRGMNWIAEHARKPAVANLSLNLDRPSPALRAAVKKAIDKGVTVVASAGNDAADACAHPPADMAEVITVGASTRKDGHWKDNEYLGSNGGRCVDLYAPGDHISSLFDNGTTTSMSGATSWAAPHVSGAAALYLQTHPHAEPADVRSWLLRHATSGAVRKVPSNTTDLLLNVHGL
ncbi:S8 family peptidase [Streptomyces sp. NPDC048639]|uniref:S8 family peptidase n=1 Tax=Streptomyces sp. NPDC048639 TaxID=3365581 RepID=UPI0037176972